MARPTLVFDGECGFCRRFVLRWQEQLGPALDYVPYQELDPEVRESMPEVEVAIHLLLPDGTKRRGAEAVFTALGIGGRPLTHWAYRFVPGFAPLSEAFYSVVAGNRALASRLTRWFVGDDLAPSRYFLSRRLYLGFLAVIFFMAFISIRVQIDGLIGSRGIFPAADFLDAVKARLGDEAAWKLPTLFWRFGASDAALHRACDLGLAFSVLLFLGIWPRLALLALWALYLSIAAVGNLFLGYQWDVLLLEVGFLSIFFAPWRWIPWRRSPEAVSSAGRWLLVLLLVKLMFLSGLVKLLSGDDSWKDLTALDYHYWTQPLPAWTAHYVHHLPRWFHKLSVALTFAIEMGAPFLLFGPRRLRHLGVAAIIFLMFFIGATGSYNFFNLLTVALCLPAVDDRALLRLIPRHLRDRLTSPPAPRAASWRRWAVVPLFAYLTLLSGAVAWYSLDRSEAPPPWLDEEMDRIRSFRTLNSYGLFRVMTKERKEIILEGSDDGTTWLPYEFKWKPGRPGRAPRFAQPHQPRIDWQMWFAALGTCRHNPWFIRMNERLLQGVPEVANLLETDPFPQKPPRYLRTQVYQYQFSTPEQRAEGIWWQRGESLGSFCPPLTLENGQIAEARL